MRRSREFAADAASAGAVPCGRSAAGTPEVGEARIGRALAAGNHRC